MRLTDDERAVVEIILGHVGHRKYWTASLVKDFARRDSVLHRLYMKSEEQLSDLLKSVSSKWKFLLHPTKANKPGFHESFYERTYYVDAVGWFREYARLTAPVIIEENYVELLERAGMI